MASLVFITIVIILAWGYAFLNGANDRANSIATTVRTRALTPINALILAGVLDMAGAFVTTKVAQTIGKGIIPSGQMTQSILIAGLIGACLWTLFCTKAAIPISVTHALIGGLMGAGIAAGGLKILAWQTLTNKVFIAIILAPTLGFLAGGAILIALFWIFRKAHPRKINNSFRKGQIFTTLFMAFTHGMNDSQNSMGVITAALVAGGFITTFKVPFWVIAGSGLCMGLGTLVFGWRVMKTVGWKIGRGLQPVHAFSAELGAAIVIGVKSLIGMPVSTTQVVSGGVMGGTAVQNLTKVRWIVARKMLFAWILTIPGAAIIGAVSCLVLGLI